MPLRYASLLVIAFSALLPGKEVLANPQKNAQHCLALSMYWEARGEGNKGMTGVGWVVLNRLRSPHFPNNVCAVVFDGGEKPPCQFSWWCDGKSDRPRDKRSWDIALDLAAKLLTDPPRDPTKGALFFHSNKIRPDWKRRKTAHFGGHIYYR